MQGGQTPTDLLVYTAKKMRAPLENSKDTVAPLDEKLIRSSRWIFVLENPNRKFCLVNCAMQMLACIKPLRVAVLKAK